MPSEKEPTSARDGFFSRGLRLPSILRPCPSAPIARSTGPGPLGPLHYKGNHQQGMGFSFGIRSSLQSSKITTSKGWLFWGGSDSLPVSFPGFVRPASSKGQTPSGVLGPRLMVISVVVELMGSSTLPALAPKATPSSRRFTTGTSTSKPSRESEVRRSDGGWREWGAGSPDSFGSCREQMRPRCRSINQ